MTKLALEYRGKSRSSGELDVVFVHSIRPAFSDNGRYWDIRGFYILSHGEKETRYLNLRLNINDRCAREKLPDLWVPIGTPDDTFRLEGEEIGTGIRRLDEVWILSAKPGIRPWIDLVLRQPHGESLGNVLAVKMGHAADQFERTMRRKLKDQQLREKERLELAALEGRADLSAEDRKRRNFLRRKFEPRATCVDTGTASLGLVA